MGSPEAARLFFYLLVGVTHVPLFALYAVWFKNARMRFAKRRRTHHHHRIELAHKNNDLIVDDDDDDEAQEARKSDFTRRKQSEEEEDKEEDKEAFFAGEKPMLPRVFPSVCLQLVIDGANDANDQVMEAIDALCFVHWPRDLLEVHVLDLSSVRTMDIGESKFENAAVKCAMRWRERGVMCDVFNVSEFETTTTSSWTASGTSKAKSTVSDEITESSNNASRDVERGELGTAKASSSSTRRQEQEQSSHKIVSFGNALEKGRLKTRAEIIVPFTKNYLPDPEYLEHIVPSFYMQNTSSSSAAASSIKKKYGGGSGGGYLQTRDLRVACVVPNARYENNNLQTNTWFSVRAGRAKTAERCWKNAKRNNIRGWGWRKHNKSCWHYMDPLLMTADTHPGSETNHLMGCNEPGQKVDDGCMDFDHGHTVWGHDNRKKRGLKPHQLWSGVGGHAHDKMSPDECRRKAKEAGFKATGYRTAFHPNNTWKNTCFTYGKKNSTKGFTGNGGDAAHITMCTDPTKRVIDGC